MTSDVQASPQREILWENVTLAGGGGFKRGRIRRSVWRVKVEQFALEEGEGTELPDIHLTHAIFILCNTISNTPHADYG